MGMGNARRGMTWWQFLLWAVLVFALTVGLAPAYAQAEEQEDYEDLPAVDTENEQEDYDVLPAIDMEKANADALEKLESDGERVVQVSLGTEHSAAITESGDLWMWGNNQWGELGYDSSMTNMTTPAKVMSGVVQVSLGGTHTAAITESGELWMWGRNYSGELGDGTTTDRHYPIKVMDDVAKVSLGSQYSAAITKSGELWTWGHNYDGALGDGTDIDRNTPVKVMDDVAEVALGSAHSAAITESGELLMWGSNYAGGLGTGYTGSEYYPVKIMDNVVEVSLGSEHSAAITESGELWMWGYNRHGQLGDGTQNDCYSPKKVLEDVSHVSLGNSHSAAITKSGELWMWGKNSQGELGLGPDSPGYSSTPVKVMRGVVQVSLHSSQSAAITESGGLWTWGNNSSGQCGTGGASGSYHTTPTHIMGPEPDPTSHSVEKFALRDSTPINGEPFRFRSDLGNKGYLDYTIDYDDRWLFSSAAASKYALMKASIRVAMAAYGTGSGDRAVHIKSLMDTLGFDYTDDSVSYPDPERDTIGYAIGMKNVRLPDGTEQTIVLVAVRGGGYEKEWGGNFVVGSEGDHAGFSQAASQVKSGLEEFLEENWDHVRSQENFKVWICSYSRGAAVSNLLAAQLAGKPDAYGITERDVRAFCFACPKGAEVDRGHATDTVYDCITNVVNPIDVVPRVAPTRNLGFARYGKTYYIPSKEITNGYKRGPKAAMEEAYRSLCAHGGNGVTYSNGVYDEVNGQGKAVDAVVDAASAIDRGEFVAKLQDDVCDAAEDYLGSGTSMPQSSGIKKFLINGLIEHATNAAAMYAASHNKQNFLALAHRLDKAVDNFPTILKAHNAELTLSWVDSLGSLDGFETEYEYLKIFVNCPVDVTVYDQDGSVVGRIADGVSEEGEVATLVDEDGQKVVVLPADADFRVELAATADGEVTYTVAEYDGEAGETQRVVSWEAVPVSEGDALVGGVDAAPDGGGGTYTLKAPGGGAVDPDIDLSGEWVHDFVVVADTAEGGTVDGGGHYVDGTFCRVTATPDEGHEFAGWYEGGKLVSEEPEWRFEVEADRELEARFTSGEAAPAPIKGAAVTVAKAVYTGKALTPKVTVKLGDKTLVAGADYDVKYSNNTNAGSKAKVIITGKGSYEGSVEQEFTIAKRASTIKLAEQTTTYSGAAQAYNGKVTKTGSTGKVTYKYYSDAKCAKEVKAANVKGAATYYVKGTVAADANNKAATSAAAKLTIKPAGIAKAKVAAISDQYVTGKELRPAVKVTLSVGGKTITLKSGTDCTAKYASNTKAGTAIVTITGKGNFTGTVSAKFKILDRWQRLAGANAVATMQAIVRADGVFTASTVDTVIVAGRRDFKAALTGTGLAGLYKAPLLITDPNSATLSGPAKAELQRLKPSRVIVVGDSSVVPASHYDAIKSAVPKAKVSRVAGKTPSATAVAIAQAGKSAPTKWGKTCIVATQAAFKDALSIAPYSYAKHAPIFFTESVRMGDGKGLSSETLAAIRSGGYNKVLIVGGELAVPKSVESQLKGISCQRLAGANAIETSRLIGQFELSQGMNRKHLAVATTQDFADALAGAALAGAQGSVLVLANQTGGYGAFNALCNSKELVHGHVLGGPFALSEASEAYFKRK